MPLRGVAAAETNSQKRMLIVNRRNGEIVARPVTTEPAMPGEKGLSLTTDGAFKQRRKKNGKGERREEEDE